MIKAASLFYAIIICVLVGIFCYSLLLISNYMSLHEGMMDREEFLLRTNEAARIYYRHQIQEGKLGMTIDNDVLENGISSRAELNTWGVYNMLKVMTFSGKDTVYKIDLLGRKMDSVTALYMPDKGEPLHMVGEAKIIGDVSLPKAGIKPGYVKSQAFKAANYLHGKRSISSSQPIKIAMGMLTNELTDFDEVAWDTIEDQQLESAFNTPGIHIRASDTVISGKSLRGKIMISAKDTLFVSRSMQMDGILISAPKVVFEKGFRGNVQVFASEQIVLEEDVVLTYPSSLIITSKDKTKESLLKMKKGSQVLGSVIMVPNVSDKESNCLMDIGEGSEVIGEVFCNGPLLLTGKVIGSVYADEFYLKTKSASYKNYLMDGTINAEELPVFFVGSAIGIADKLSNVNFENYAVIEELY
ncbi:hypothetical protein JM658_11975 [Joostella atrarenae]|uniref:Polymer-forming cytoskeletal protein n=1 Tax=Joostella atrarenae TaxID=679257 RepID=A0ABS9J5D6_9FLAO|nr:hypothetical protein [Joostella atrarenae]MCF8715543.1 hypothetical protein [Joostella atrarenae]